MAKTQTLAFPMRLPDTLQAEALRLLDASRSAINQASMDLWKPRQDILYKERNSPWQKNLLTFPWTRLHG